MHLKTLILIVAYLTLPLHAMTARNQVIIRLANKPDDVQWLLQVSAKMYAEEFGFDVPRTSSGQGSPLRQELENIDKSPESRERGWIAELDGHRVGSIFVTKVDDVTAKLRVLQVTKEGRGRGIGNQLVKICIDFAKSKNYEKMVLRSAEPLAAADKLYEKFGFRKNSTYEGPSAFGPNVKATYFELDLN